MVKWPDLLKLSASPAEDPNLCSFAKRHFRSGKFISDGDDSVPSRIGSEVAPMDSDRRRLLVAGILRHYRKYIAWPVDRGSRLPGLDLRNRSTIWRVSSQNSQP